MRLLVFVLSSVLFIPQSYGAACSSELNDAIFAAFRVKLDLPMVHRWGFNDPDQRDVQGWRPLTLQGLDDQLRENGVKTPTRHAVRQAIRLFDVSLHEVEQMRASEKEGLGNPGVAAAAAARALVSIERVPVVDYNRQAYLCTWPEGDCPLVAEHASFAFNPENFTFVPNWSEAPESDLQELTRHTEAPKRRANAFVVTKANLENPIELAHWTADLLAAVSVYSDLGLLSVYTFSNRILARAGEPMDDWFEGHIRIGRDGHIYFDESVLGVFVRSRAEAVRAYVIHKLSGTDLDAGIEQAGAIALNAVRERSGQEVVDALDLKSQEVFVEVGVKLAQAFKETIDRAKPFRKYAPGRGRRR